MAASFLSLLLVAALSGCMVNAINCEYMTQGIDYYTGPPGRPRPGYYVPGSDDFRVLRRYMSGSCLGECIMKGQGSITDDDKTTSCRAWVSASGEVEQTDDCPYSRYMQNRRGFRAVCKGRYINDHPYQDHNALPVPGRPRRICDELNGQVRNIPTCNTRCSCVDTPYHDARCVANINGVATPKQPRVFAPPTCKSYDRIFHNDGKWYQVSHGWVKEPQQGYNSRIYVCNDFPYAVGYQRMCTRSIREIPQDQVPRYGANEAYENYYDEDSLFDYDAEIAYLDEEIAALEEELNLLKRQ